MLFCQSVSIILSLIIWQIDNISWLPYTFSICYTLQYNKHVILANDVADEGILVHARDNSDLTWVNPKTEYRGHDFFMIGLFGENDAQTGEWIDEPGTGYPQYFICEGLI